MMFIYTGKCISQESNLATDDRSLWQYDQNLYNCYLILSLFLAAFHKILRTNIYRPCQHSCHNNCCHQYWHSHFSGQSQLSAQEIHSCNPYPHPSTAHSGKLWTESTPLNACCCPNSLNTTLFVKPMPDFYTFILRLQQSFSHTIYMMYNYRKKYYVSNIYIGHFDSWYILWG